MTLAGTPAQIDIGGKSEVTTAPAPDHSSFTDRDSCGYHHVGAEPYVIADVIGASFPG